jgi:hypothetical protein
MNGMTQGGTSRLRVPSGDSSNIDNILIPKIMALPIELKQSLLKIITDMENPSAQAPIEPGLESNLMGGGMV